VNRAFLAAGCVAVLAACHFGPGQPAGQQPPATAIAGASSGPRGAPHASPTTPTPSIPVSTVSFNCRLPVLKVDQVGKFQGGFVTFPGGTYQEDPGGAIEGIGDGDLGTKAQPVLTAPGYPGPFYDFAMRRWVPAGPGETSPDGSSYAVAFPPLGGAGGNYIHVYAVSTGADRTLRVDPPTGALWRVLDFDGRYVYLVSLVFGQSGALPSGVWRLDTATSELLQLSQARSILFMRYPQLWVGRVNPSDPSPPTSSQTGQLFDSIVQVDLTSGVQTTWIYREGTAISILGLDMDGHPVVVVTRGSDSSASAGTVLLLARPGDPGTQISAGDVPLSHMQADVGRIWFGTDYGIYLWTPGGGLHPVFAYGEPIWPAGRCV
jgi:hypothetical protein